MLLEDSDLDARLEVAALEKAGFALDVRRVQARDEFLAALDPPPDLILADYSLPAFDGATALALTRERLPDVPFVVVSGFVGEELAVEMLHRGATDYVLKRNLDRLAPAVRHALDGARDRAERRRFEAELRERELFLRLAVAAGRMGTWTHDLAAGTVEWDLSAHDLFGVPLGQFDGTFTGFMRIVHPDDRLAVATRVATALENRSEHEVEFRVTPPGGSTRWVLGRGQVLVDEAGRPARVVGVGLDITARKQVEETLREGFVRFRAMADEAPVLIWVSRPDGRGEFANRRYREFTGRPRGSGGGSDWHDDIHPDDLAGYLALDSAAHADRRPYATQARYRRHDGEYRWMQVVAVPRNAPDGTFTGFLGTCTDITEMKRNESELREANRRKNEFLAMLAHELRNPLAALRVAADLLRSSSAEPGWSLGVLDHQIRHMGRLVDDLLDVSRLEHGQIVLRRQRVELGEVLRRAAEVSRPQMEARGHALAVDGPAKPLVVDGDPARLEQVFANLLHNAAKYTPAGGRVTLQARDGDGTVKVSVCDTGIGIAAEMLPRVFEPFAQADRSLERADGGLGIGLTLVRRLVAMHGGTVEAHSDGIGRGSEFVVRLPLCVGAMAPAAEAPPPRGPARKVLVVDDNRAAADGLATLLRAEGHAVAAAYDGRAGVAAALADPPDVVVLDIGLPGLNGFEVAKRLKAEPALAAAKLVALTGYGTEEDRARAVANGFDYYLIKPADLDDLREVLAEPR